ncbi:hypothetical protein L1987_12654 [Smallanthus sonchifolius]|uniref:Uncharacterized protein n=1 Tax=Smallanthus sonchifolius TaxID=185202 RepID=A0ACB9JFX0_9ASTR|nr:hypothetical protein L1987_12654 [Smallanthus sonchifolius]
MITCCSDFFFQGLSSKALGLLHHIYSMKSMVGRMLGAACAVEAVATIKAQNYNKSKLCWINNFQLQVGIISLSWAYDVFWAIEGLNKHCKQCIKYDKRLLAANGGVLFGIGKNTHIKRSIIEKNALIGDNVKKFVILQQSFDV